MLELVTRRFFSHPAEPADASVLPTNQAASSGRPRIGLALGGGVARGWGAIGVLRGLVESGIEPDILAGTSMGAVVAGCYLAGRLDELEDFARSLTPRRVLLLADLHLGSGGLIGGDRLGALLTQYLGDVRIEDFDRPFIAVATELTTGHEIWFSSGRLVDALRASYALPGLFEPYRIGDRLLVDGALVNPVPVAPARAAGAEMMIAANLASDVIHPGTVIHATAEAAARPPDEAAPAFGHPHSLSEKLWKRLFTSDRRKPGLASVMMDSFNIIQDRITRSRLAGDPPDVVIAPKLAQIGLFEFHRADEAIAIGRTAAHRAATEIEEKIARLSRSA